MLSTEVMKEETFKQKLVALSGNEKFGGILEKLNNTRRG